MLTLRAAARDPSMADFAALAANAKKAPNVKNAVALLKHMRAHKVRRSDLVVTYGGIALRSAKRLGDDAWAVYEQTLLAALDVDARGDAVEECVRTLCDGEPEVLVEDGDAFARAYALCRCVGTTRWLNE